MPACLARSRSERAARPSARTISHAAARTVARADWRRASRQSTDAEFFNIVSNLCTMLKERQQSRLSSLRIRPWQPYDGCQGLWLHGSWTRQLRSWRLKTSELTLDHQPHV